VFGEVVPGGIGATAYADGIEVVAGHVTNCHIPPTEAIEMESPVLYLRRELRTDSGGPGRYRGGVGQVLTYRILGADPELQHTSQKSVSLPQGVAGGRPGDGGRWIINEGLSAERALSHAIGDIEPLAEGDTVTHYTPGGGGYGHPSARDPAAVQDDVRRGLVSLAAAERDYGVRLDPDTLDGRRSCASRAAHRRIRMDTSTKEKEMTLPHKLLRILLSCTLAIAATAGAADYPTQPIHIVVPWAAGGFTDVLGRLIAEKMSKTLGQPVIVDNKPGATGGIGSEFVSRAAPDGYNLLLTTSDALVWNVNVAKAHESDPAKNAKPTYDPIKDFTQIIFMGTQPVLLFVGSDVPARNISEFVAMAKAKPGAVSFGSSGEGSAVHLGMEMFSATSGIKLNHVPYKGINPALLDVIGGQVQSLFISLQGGGAYMKAGKLRPLAITSLTRSPLAPDVPTLAESGYRASS
jgi:tripartite-type tricarboxylate transporter receptor subunit TctC